MDFLPFDMLFEIYNYLNLQEKIMMSKNFQFFKYLLKQNILNKIINVGLAKSIGFRSNIRIIYSSNNENSIIYPFFVDDETFNKINNCFYLEEQNNLIKSILLNGITFKDVFYSIDQNTYLSNNGNLSILNLTSEKSYIPKFFFHDTKISEKYVICRKFCINNTKDKFIVSDYIPELEEVDSDEDSDYIPELEEVDNIS